MNDLKSFYSDKVETYQSALNHTKKNLFYTAAFRLIAFIGFAFLLYLYFRFYNNYVLAISFVVFALFLFLIKRSNILNLKKRLLENKLFVNINELQILNGGKNQFDSGLVFQSSESYYSDLDIFGEASLYHLLNRTSSRPGSGALAYRLKHPYTDPDTILKHQHAVKEFAAQHAVRENIIAVSLMHKDGTGDLTNIQQWLNEPAHILHSRYITVARFVLPAINLITLGLSLYLDNYALLLMSVFICWLHIGYYSKYIQKQHALLGKKQEVLDQFVVILNEFEKVQIKDSSVLQELKTIATEAHAEIRKLASLSNLLDQRMNMLVNILLNSFVLYDLQVITLLEKWKLKNNMNFSGWINCVASIETLTSLSTFAFNHPVFSYPKLIDELTIEAIELGHPLIPETESIANDVSLGRSAKLLLITGSNMSGKTTYLRTIGINVVLAQCGAPVCATSFSFKPVNIYSSIRISDSLQEHTSYFMAELKRLSEIKESIATDQPSLVLIDEILRGTNSEDKYFGSAEFMKKLIQYNCLTLFATHDLKLSELENQFQGQIENYCFESIIKDDELLFDYKVLKGVAQNKNASFLMTKMKII